MVTLAAEAMDRIKVPGGLGIADVSLRIGSMSMNKSKIRLQRIFQNVSSAVKYPRFLGSAVGNDAANHGFLDN